MRRRALLAPVLLVAGCTMGPNYVPPQVDAPPAYRYEEKDAQATANTAFWKQFGDPVLDGLIAEAIANNPQVLIAAARVEQAAAVLTQTTAPLYPAGRVRCLGRTGPGERIERHPHSAVRGESPDFPADAGRRKLGDRPLGADPETLRSRSGEPPRRRGGPPRRRPLPRLVRRHDVHPAPRLRRAARRLEALARDLRASRSGSSS